MTKTESGIEREMGTEQPDPKVYLKLPENRVAARLLRWAAEHPVREVVQLDVAAKGDDLSYVLSEELRESSNLVRVEFSIHANREDILHTLRRILAAWEKTDPRGSFQRFLLEKAG